MSEWQPRQISYVRARRSVRPNLDLEQFLTKARNLADDTFTPKASTLKRRYASAHDELRPGFKYIAEGLGVSSVQFFTINSLFLTLFERRAVAGDEASQHYQRLSERMGSQYLVNGKKSKRPAGPKILQKRENPIYNELKQLEHDYFAAQDNSSKLMIDCDRLEVGEDELTDTGVVYSLKIKDGPEASLLKAQATMLHHAAAKTVVGRMATKPDEFATDATRLPILYVPNGAASEHVSFFNQLAQELPVNQLEAGPIVWESNVIIHNLQD